MFSKKHPTTSNIFKPFSFTFSQAHAQEPSQIFKKLQIVFTHVSQAKLHTSPKIFKLSSRIGVTFKNEEWPRNGYPSHGAELSTPEVPVNFRGESISDHPGPIKKAKSTVSTCVHKASNNFKHLQNMFTHIFRAHTQNTSHIFKKLQKSSHTFPKQIFQKLQMSSQVFKLSSHILLQEHEHIP